MLGGTDFVEVNSVLDMIGGVRRRMMFFLKNFVTPFLQDIHYVIVINTFPFLTWMDFEFYIKLSV